MTLEEKQKALDLRKQNKGYGEIAKIIEIYMKNTFYTFKKYLCKKPLIDKKFFLI